MPRLLDFTLQAQTGGFVQTKNYIHILHSFSRGPLHQVVDGGEQHHFVPFDLEAQVYAVGALDIAALGEAALGVEHKGIFFLELEEYLVEIRLLGPPGDVQYLSADHPSFEGDQVGGEQYAFQVSNQVGLLEDFFLMPMLCPRIVGPGVLIPFDIQQVSDGFFSRPR
jgi:hypothetical protein